METERRALKPCPQLPYNPRMTIVWGVLAAFFIGIYILVHRTKVRAMRRYMDRGGWDEPPSD